jgi:RNA polymerase sigma-70 factor (ECF subfamily)
MTDNGDTDKALVLRAQHGDTEAFGRLVAKYQEPLARVLTRFVKDSHEAQDVTQEAFIRAFRALPSFRGESAFFTWLYAIGVNSARNHLAFRARRVPTLSDHDAQEAERFDGAGGLRDENTPEDVLMSKQLCALLSKAVDGLSPELRRTLMLREIDGLTYEEIAALTECPLGTVRSRLFRAREVIEERLQAHGTTATLAGGGPFG